MATGIDKTLNRPAVLLTGASGQIGVFIIPRLLRAGFQVIAISRKGKPGYYPTLEQLEWVKSVDDVEPGKICEYLVSAGPMELVLRILGSRNQIHSAVIFSSSSVISKQDSLNPAERNQMRAMLSIESELESIFTKQLRKLVILRPTMIYGCGLDTNISRLAAWIGRFGFIPLNGRASGLRQPVHADDLAEVAVSALLTDQPLPGSLVLAGGSTLTYSDMVNAIFSAFGRSSRVIRLPQWLFVLLVNLRPGSDINSEMVRRQADDLVFDDRDARNLLAYNPRPFEPSEEDFRLPKFD